MSNQSPTHPSRPGRGDKDGGGEVTDRVLEPGLAREHSKMQRRGTRGLLKLAWGETGLLGPDLQVPWVSNGGQPES